MDEKFSYLFRNKLLFCKYKLVAQEEQWKTFSLEYYQVNI